MYCMLFFHYSYIGNIFLYHGFPAANLSLTPKVYSEDIYGRTQLVGYGFVHLPTSPGFHQIECPTWQLAGLFSLFLLLLAGFVSLFAGFFSFVDKV